uniref:Rho GDP-dissociation inhibitor 1 n=1 Tax=Leersia perrieri TaxID=77586 RepID=A0A0D9V9F1_9ORYZ
MDNKDKEKEKEKEKEHQTASANDVEEEEEDEDGNKRAVVLGPQVPLKEQLELDKDDESLRRWKEQLLGQVDTEQLGETAEPEVKVLNLTILSPDRPDLVLPIPFVPDEKGYAFALKDGSTYSFRFNFVVSNNIVSGLKYTNTVWKTGVRVENQKVMLGTFSPQLEPYTYEGEEETTPAGMFARGSYSAKLKFVDDDGKCYLEMSYYFEIRKEWPVIQ